MINIAICDDDRALTGVVEQLLRRIATEYEKEISCEAFFDGASLVEAVTEQGMCFDLVYLDIEMDGMNGISTAQALRNLELPALIVYLSGHEEYLKELFYTEPFRFLPKPIDEKDFLRVFLSACERLRQRAGYFSFSYGRVFHRIPYDRISCFESSGRTIFIHVADRGDGNAEALQDRFYGRMNDIEKRIAAANGRFLRIHQSYLVNFDYIHKFAHTEVVMLDGRKLQISPERRKAVQTKICALLGEEEYRHE